MQSHICFVQPYVFTYVVIITESGTPAVVRWDKSIVQAHSHSITKTEYKNLVSP